MNEVSQKLAELYSKEELTSEELSEKGLEEGKIVTKWITKEITSKEVWEQTKKIIEGQKRYSITFGNDFELFRETIIEVFANEDFAREQTQHELEHARIFEKYNMNYSFGILIVNGASLSSFINLSATI